MDHLECESLNDLFISLLNHSKCSLDEGGIVYKSDYSCFVETNLKDHLGNVRVVYGNDGLTNGIRQVNAYYPFGMQINNLSADDGLSKNMNEYKYKGKMFQDELGLNWLDYGARFYDPVIGRWHSMDPLAEVSRKWTPYNYCMDNPLIFIDPDGLWPYPNPFAAVKNEISNLWDKAISTVGKAYTQVLMLTDVDDVHVLGTALTEPLTGKAASHVDGTNANGDDVQAAKEGILMPGISGGATKRAAKLIENTVEKIAPTSRAARREAMRQSGIPTSQPLIPDKATKSADKVFITRDGNKTVQNAKNDVSHQGKPHWEAGATKKNDNSPDGLNRSGNNNKPQMSKPKTKVYYETKKN